MSSNRTSIKCHCGQRVVAKDVMQTGYYVRLFGPSYVYVKYRCSRCKKMGEQFIKQEEWEAGILKDRADEVEIDDRERFESLGPIGINEVINFHFELESAKDLTNLDSSAQTTKKVKQKSSSDR
jgi:DNA-directed RNA polymerase subunit RPC12/RpoP